MARPPMSIGAMALRHWKENIAPDLRHSGVDELELERRSARYFVETVQQADVTLDQLTEIWLTPCETCRHPRYKHTPGREGYATSYRHYSGKCTDVFPTSGLKCPCPRFLRYLTDRLGGEQRRRP